MFQSLWAFWYSQDQEVRVGTVGSSRKSVQPLHLCSQLGITESAKSMGPAVVLLCRAP